MIMKTYQIVFCFLLGLTTVSQANAQEGEVNVNLNYTFGIPTSSFRDDIVNKTSFRGWTGTIMYGVTENFSVGFGSGFQDFYQKYPRALYKLPNGSDISAVLSNSVQMVPLLATVHYQFIPYSALQPYVGLGVGGNIITFRQYIGEFESSRNSFGFAMRPEAGVNIPITYRFGINVNGMFNYMPYHKDGFNNLNYWGINAGIRFGLN